MSLSSDFLAHIRETEVRAGETWLAVVFTVSFLVVLSVVLGFLWWVL
jgi:hypothetical protein